MPKQAEWFRSAPVYEYVYTVLAFGSAVGSSSFSWLGVSVRKCKKRLNTNINIHTVLKFTGKWVSLNFLVVESLSVQVSSRV